MAAMFTIREETLDDAIAIREVNRLAFGGDAEGNLVDRLRDDGLVICSLVAEEEGRIVGHILFSQLQIETPNGVIRSAALAPMAVLPDRQGKGSAPHWWRRAWNGAIRRGSRLLLYLDIPNTTRDLDSQRNEPAACKATIRETPSWLWN